MKFYLNVPYEESMLASSRGAKWDAKAKAYCYQGDALPAGLESYASEDYSLERWFEDEANKRVRPPKKATTHFTPRPHQALAAKKIGWASQKGYRGFVEADDVGTGKTLSCLLGVYAAAKIAGVTPQKPAKLLVVTTKASIPHWRDSIAASGVNPYFRIVVLNYDQLKKLLVAPPSAKSAKRKATKNKRIANQGKPLIHWDYIIADESHRMKNVTQTAHAFERVARYTEPAKSAPFVVWASATIGQSPVEIGYLAPLLGQLTKSGVKTAAQWGAYLVEKGFHVKEGKAGAVYWVSAKNGDTEEKRQEVSAAQRKDVGRIRGILFTKDSPSIRRLPTDIAGWPEIQRMVHSFPLSVRQWALYQSAWTAFRQEMSLSSHGADPKSALAAQLRFRQKVSLVKTDETLGLIQDMLDNGHQVAVSVEFMESLDKMKDALEKKGITCAEISGRRADREAERLRFQRGEARVVFFTVLEAISLHAGQVLADGSRASRAKRDTVVHDIRYSSIACSQIEGRCHRDGEASNVYYMTGKRTVEVNIAKTMFNRLGNMKALSGDDTSNIQQWLETYMSEG